jgi:hypothetical protein
MRRLWTYSGKEWRGNFIIGRNELCRRRSATATLLIPCVKRLTSFAGVISLKGASRADSIAQFVTAI